jgi:hypothetical protein
MSKIHRLSGRPCPAPAQHPDPELVGPASVPAQGRALVRLAPAQATSTKTANSRPAANFLAHLIATADGAPQTRHRRRAEPDQADAIYAAASAFAAPTGRLLRRTA